MASVRYVWMRDWGMVGALRTDLENSRMEGDMLVGQQWKIVSQADFTDIVFNYPVLAGDETAGFPPLPGPGEALEHVNYPDDTKVGSDWGRRPGQEQP